MDVLMFNPIGTKPKVFYPVVVSYFVFVVDLFQFGEISTYVLLHYMTVFANVTSQVAMLMVRHFDHYIAVVVDIFFSHFKIGTPSMFRGCFQW